MTNEEIRVLIREAQDGSEEAMEKIVKVNKKLLYKIVNKYQYTEHDPEDLFQIASIGIVKCVQRFDLSSTVKFSTYAYPLVYHEIYDFLRAEGMIRTPRPIQKVERLITKHECSDKPIEEISKLIGIADLELIKETLVYMDRGKVFSLDKLVLESPKGNDITLEETIEGDVNGEWLESVLLRDAIEKLDERERAILDMRYKKDMHQHEVAKVLGIYQVYVHRIETRAIQKLRAYMGVPLELPKVEKPKVEKPTNTGPKEPTGDRDKAIHLLKTSSLSYNDISSLTGVPLGTMGKLGRKYRPKHIKEIIKNRATHKKGELNVYEAQ